MTPYIIVAAVGYLLGSIPFGYLLVKLFKGEDVRVSGSGNIGATNVARKSPALGVATLLLDAAKGLAAVLLAKALFNYSHPQLIMTIAAFFAVSGHLFPVWLKFRGGKGVATLLGILIPLLPPAAGVYAAIWILLLLTIRISSVAGMAAVISAPIMAAILQSSLFPLLLGFAVLVLWKHRENILRLRRGNEPRIGETKA